MSEYYESIADRWKREYERQHPDGLVKVKAPSVISPATEEGSDQFLPSESASEPVRNGRYPSLEATDKNVHLSRVEIDPIVRAARETRLRLQLSQRLFALSIGISHRTLREWEQGRRKPSAAARCLLRLIVDQPDRF